MDYDGRWIPLSADQFRRYRFRETPVGRRGLRPDDVQDAMNRAAYEIEQWRLRSQLAQTENARLRDWFKREGINVDTPRPRQPAEEATRLLIIAQRKPTRSSLQPTLKPATCMPTHSHKPKRSSNKPVTPANTPLANIAPLPAPRTTLTSKNSSACETGLGASSRF